MSRAYKEGQHVYSARYGRGEIVAVEGYGEKEKLTIRFESSGVREVLSHYFVLEPFDNELHAALPPGGTASAPEAPEAEPGPPVPAARERAEPEPAGGRLDMDEIKEALREVIREELGAGSIRIHPRWKGGQVILKPGKEGLADKTIPLDDFFHKIVMVRDRLRTLEQKVNAHPGLGDAEKVELQQYVTRIYGSLTTFNILFADREDWFVGQKAGGE